ncbi:MAG: hypothetical protein ACRD07_08190 [Acidimicrobiales bacterium]
MAYRVRHGLLEEAATGGTAPLVTSHNMVEAERLCQRVVFISGGRIVADGVSADGAPVLGEDVIERFACAGRLGEQGEPWSRS